MLYYCVQRCIASSSNSNLYKYYITTNDLLTLLFPVQLFALSFNSLREEFSVEHLFCRQKAPIRKTADADKPIFSIVVYVLFTVQVLLASSSMFTLNKRLYYFG